MLKQRLGKLYGVTSRANAARRKKTKWCPHREDIFIDAKPLVGAGETSAPHENFYLFRRLNLLLPSSMASDERGKTSQHSIR